MPEIAMMPPEIAGTLPAIPAPTDLGRHKLAEWTPEIWERIDKEVRCELARACVVTKFLPICAAPTPSKRTVAADVIEHPSASTGGDGDGSGPTSRVDIRLATIGADGRDGTGNGALTIDPRLEVPLVEGSQPFVLTKEQFFAEAEIATGMTLAARSANALAQFIDYTVLQGGTDSNMLQAAEETGQIEPVRFPPDETHPRKKKEDKSRNRENAYGENTFAAVARAYARLQGNGFYGPYACVLYHEQFADAFAPLATTLIMPADRIRPLMSAGFYGTGTLPERRGVVVSIGGQTVDLAVGVAGATEYSRIDERANRWFRVYARFALRIKDPRALVLLEFDEPATAKQSEHSSDDAASSSEEAASSTEVETTGSRD